GPKLQRDTGLEADLNRIPRQIIGVGEASVFEQQNRIRALGLRNRLQVRKAMLQSHGWLMPRNSEARRSNHGRVQSGYLKRKAARPGGQDGFLELQSVRLRTAYSADRISRPASRASSSSLTEKSILARW